LNVPARGIGTATLQKFLDKADESKSDLFQAMQNNQDLDPKRQSSIKEFIELIQWSRLTFAERPLPEAISLLVERLNFFDFIDKSYDNAKQAERRRNDVMFFIDSAERFLKFRG